MQFLADTVTLVRHFSDSGHLGKGARKAMDGADQKQNIIFISMVSMFEILYLSEKNRIRTNLVEAIEIISRTSNYQIVDLNLEMIVEAQKVRGLELHDRLIVSTARVLGVPMLTSDKMITESGLVEVVWN
ncbi:MAG TPA: type II toxin-antitoxin system VapC family toxin [Candidatus Kapabacteria bacterium]|nr:type II toxin-antitoxin system VapC family toxin [Candidatus Kapabacteria bacterium]